MNQTANVFEATADNFQELVLQRSQAVPVLVDFWAGWCAPCKMLMPILAGLAEKSGGQWVLAKVDTDAQQALAQQYQVRSLPTVKLFRNGAVVDEFMGALPESQVREFLDRHIERESDRMAEAAERLAAGGDFDAALGLIDQALAGDPDNPRVIFRRLQLLLAGGRLEDLERDLAALPIALAELPQARQLRAQLRFRRIFEQSSEAAAATSATQRHSAAAAMLAGEHEKALQLLMQLLSTDPRFEDGAPKQDLLAAFELIDEPDLVNRYRRQMFNLLH